MIAGLRSSRRGPPSRWSPTAPSAMTCREPGTSWLPPPALSFSGPTSANPARSVSSSRPQPQAPHLHDRRAQLRHRTSGQQLPALGVRGACRHLRGLPRGPRPWRRRHGRHPGCGRRRFLVTDTRPAGEGTTCPGRACKTPCTRTSTRHSRVGLRAGDRWAARALWVLPATLGRTSVACLASGAVTLAVSYGAVRVIAAGALVGARRNLRGGPP